MVSIAAECFSVLVINKLILTALLCANLMSVLPESEFLI